MKIHLVITNLFDEDKHTDRGGWGGRGGTERETEVDDEVSIRYA